MMDSTYGESDKRERHDSSSAPEIDKGALRAIDSGQCWLIGEREKRVYGCLDFD